MSDHFSVGMGKFLSELYLRKEITVLDWASGWAALDKISGPQARLTDGVRNEYRLEFSLPRIRQMVAVWCGVGADVVEIEAIFEKVYRCRPLPGHNCDQRKWSEWILFFYETIEKNGKINKMKY